MKKIHMVGSALRSTTLCGLPESKHLIAWRGTCLTCLKLNALLKKGRAEVAQVTYQNEKLRREVLRSPR